MPTEITSLTNAKVKEVVRLRQRKQRDNTKTTIVEGHKEFYQALESKVRMKEIYYCPELMDNNSLERLEAILTADMPIYTTSPAVFAKISYGDRQDGVLAVCHFPVDSIDQMRVQPDGLYVVIEQVEKPGNLGAILRTADAVGVDGVIICDPRTDLYNPNVIRASLGTIFVIQTVTGTNQQVNDFLKRNSIRTCAAVVGAEQSFYQADWQGARAVVLGSEHDGLTDFWIQQADQTINIPMRGRGDSLNVSVSAAVILYEATRQREQQN